LKDTAKNEQKHNINDVTQLDGKYQIAGANENHHVVYSYIKIIFIPFQNHTEEEAIEIEPLSPQEQDAEDASPDPGPSSTADDIDLPPPDNRRRSLAEEQRAFMALVRENLQAPPTPNTTPSAAQEPDKVECFVGLLRRQLRDLPTEAWRNEAIRRLGRHMMDIEEEAASH